MLVNHLRCPSITVTDVCLFCLSAETTILVCDGLQLVGLMDCDFWTREGSQIATTGCCCEYTTCAVFMCGDTGLRLRDTRLKVPVYVTEVRLRII